MSIFYGKKRRLTAKKLKETAHRSRSIKRYGKDGLVDQLNDFKYYTCEVTDFICETIKNVNEMHVFPDVVPGTLRTKLKDHPPENKESMDTCLKDFKNYILPMTLHWKHKNCYAYLPGGNGFPNIIGDMLSTTLGGIGFSWASQPSLTELERITMDWVCHALELPEFFSFEMTNGNGGGCIQNSASDAIFSSIIAARHEQLLTNNTYEEDHNGNAIIKRHPGEILKKLVCYVSQEGHSCVLKSARIALCTIRVLKPDNHDVINGEILERQIKKDKHLGLIPFYCCATLGTTIGCSFDDLSSLGPICKKYDVWLHVDAAYGGNAFICPEYRFLKRGIEYAQSLEVNPYKFLMGSIDCCCLFIKDGKRYKKAWQCNATYANDEFDDGSNMMEIDYRHYGLSTSRRMTSLKLYCLFRRYGVAGLQRCVRNAVKCAKYFECLVQKDNRFEVSNDVVLAVVCFRQKRNVRDVGSGQSKGPLSHTDKQNINLLIRINKTGKLYLAPGTLKGKYILRFSINYEFATIQMITDAWNLIQSYYVTKLDSESKDKTAHEIRQTVQLSHLKLVSKETYDIYLSRYSKTNLSVNPLMKLNCLPFYHVDRQNSTIPMTFGPIIVPADDKYIANLFGIKRENPIKLALDNERKALVESAGTNTVTLTRNADAKSATQLKAAATITDLSIKSDEDLKNALIRELKHMQSKTGTSLASDRSKMEILYESGVTGKLEKEGITSDEDVDEERELERMKLKSLPLNDSVVSDKDESAENAILTSRKSKSTVSNKSTRSLDLEREFQRAKLATLPDISVANKNDILTSRKSKSTLSNESNRSLDREREFQRAKLATLPQISIANKTDASLRKEISCTELVDEEREIQREKLKNWMPQESIASEVDEEREIHRKILKNWMPYDTVASENDKSGMEREISEKNHRLPDDNIDHKRNDDEREIQREKFKNWMPPDSNASDENDVERETQRQKLKSWKPQESSASEDDDEKEIQRNKLKNWKPQESNASGDEVDREIQKQKLKNWKPQECSSSEDDDEREIQRKKLKNWKSQESNAIGDDIEREIQRNKLKNWVSQKSSASEGNDEREIQRKNLRNWKPQETVDNGDDVEREMRTPHDSASEDDDEKEIQRKILKNWMPQECIASEMDDEREIQRKHLKNWIPNSRVADYKVLQRNKLKNWISSDVASENNETDDEREIQRKSLRKVSNYITTSEDDLSDDVERKIQKDNLRFSLSKLSTDSDEDIDDTREYEREKLKHVLSDHSIITDDDDHERQIQREKLRTLPLHEMSSDDGDDDEREIERAKLKFSTYFCTESEEDYNTDVDERQIQRQKLKISQNYCAISTDDNNDEKPVLTPGRKQKTPKSDKRNLSDRDLNVLHSYSTVASLPDFYKENNKMELQRRKLKPSIPNKSISSEKDDNFIARSNQKLTNCSTEYDSEREQPRQKLKLPNYSSFSEGNENGKRSLTNSTNDDEEREMQRKKLKCMRPTDTIGRNNSKDVNESELHCRNKKLTNYSSLSEVDIDGERERQRQKLKLPIYRSVDDENCEKPASLFNYSNDDEEREFQREKLKSLRPINTIVENKSKNVNKSQLQRQNTKLPNYSSLSEAEIDDEREQQRQKLKLPNYSSLRNESSEKPSSLLNYSNDDEEREMQRKKLKSVRPVDKIVRNKSKDVNESDSQRLNTKLPNYSSLSEADIDDERERQRQKLKLPIYSSVDNEKPPSLLNYNNDDDEIEFLRKKLKSLREIDTTARNKNDDYTERELRRPQLEVPTNNSTSDGDVDDERELKRQKLKLPNYGSENDDAPSSLRSFSNDDDDERELQREKLKSMPKNTSCDTYDENAIKSSTRTNFATDSNNKKLSRISKSPNSQSEDEEREFERKKLMDFRPNNTTEEDLSDDITKTKISTQMETEAQTEILDLSLNSQNTIDDKNTESENSSKINEIELQTEKNFFFPDNKEEFENSKNTILSSNNPNTPQIYNHSNDLIPNDDKNVVNEDDYNKTLETSTNIQNDEDETNFLSENLFPLPPNNSFSSQENQNDENQFSSSKELSNRQEDEVELLTQKLNERYNNFMPKDEETISTDIQSNLATNNEIGNENPIEIQEASTYESDDTTTLTGSDRHVRFSQTTDDIEI